MYIKLISGFFHLYVTIINGRGVWAGGLPQKKLITSWIALWRVHVAIRWLLSIQSKNSHIVWIVPRLCEKYTTSEWPCSYSSGYELEYIVPRLYQKILVVSILSLWRCIPGAYRHCHKYVPFQHKYGYIRDEWSQFMEDTVEPSVFLPGIISLVITCIGIIWNNSFLVGGRPRAEARMDPRPLRTSRSTAHGTPVVLRQKLRCLRWSYNMS